MNPAPNPSSGNGASPAVSLSLDDVVYILFRHKWLILSFVVLGITGVAALRVARPPQYMSRAKIMVKFVMDNTNVGPEKEQENVRLTGQGGAGAIRSEMEILTSLDVALKALDHVDPALVLAAFGGGSDRTNAAGVIASGIEAEVPPSTSILTVSFKHPDPTVVQPTLSAVIQAYLDKHNDVHGGGGAMREYIEKQREELAAKLAQTEERWKKLQEETKILFPEDTEESYKKRINKVQNDLLDARGTLAEVQAVFKAMGTGTTNDAGGVETMVPQEIVSDYNFMVTELSNLKREYRSMLVTYTPAHPQVVKVLGQMKKLAERKEELEATYGALKYLGPTLGMTSTNLAGMEATPDVMQVKRLEERVKVLETLLQTLQVEAAHVMATKPQWESLKRQRDEAQRAYDFFVNSEAAHRNQSLAAGNVNISGVQKPTPPFLDLKKFKKMALIVLAGCIGLGFGLAFLIEVFLDRTIKRGVDIERHLRIPVMLTIPDTTWNNRLWLPRWLRSKGRRSASTSAAGNSGLVRWDPSDGLRFFTEGLCERLVTHFEVRNLNQKKPKLVAVTGCGVGSGVTTLAGGLAAELSRTGDGNVLLVDMTSEEGVARAYHQGKANHGLTETLATEPGDVAEPDAELPLATVGNEENDKVMHLMPSRFGHLIPRLKGSDYDYIIFDMPPVTATSPTPRLAGHMDLVLLVLEAERTGQQAARRASTLMRESKANVTAVLNKYHAYVPEKLSSEA